MSRWDAGEGHHDTVSFGSGRRPPSSRTRRISAAVAGTVVGLAVGLALGILVPGLAQDARPAKGDPTSTFPIVAGVVATTSLAGDRGPKFEVQMLNSGSSPVQVTGFRFDGLRSHIIGVEESTLYPDVWRSFLFSAAPDCFSGVPLRLPSVRVSLRATGRPDSRQSTVDVPLPGSGQVLLQYQRAMCDARPVTRPGQLAGVWVLEEPYGLFPEGKGVHLVRFQRDGTFSADPEGVLLLDQPHGVEGTYTLRKGRLVTEVRGGYGGGCRNGDRAVWKPGLLDGYDVSGTDRSPRLTMEWVGGRCPDNGRGEVWVLRRLLNGVDGATADSAVR